MNYELAKELKEAGLKPIWLDAPDESKNFYGGRIIYGYTHPDFVPEGAIYRPNLSELIEACGDPFAALYHRNTAELVCNDLHGKEVIRGKDWVARYYDIKLGSFNEKFGWGDTPEEAVARLWLALNPKKE